MTLTRATHFKQNYLAWAALAHFLPADLLREFCYAMVELLSVGQLSLDELFDENLLKSDSHFFDSWELRPLESSEPLAQYLQLRIRHFAWSNDSDVGFDKAELGKTAVNAKAMEDAVRLGAADLFFPNDFFDKISFPEDQSSVRQLQSAVQRATGLINNTEVTDDDLSIIGQPISMVEMPLAALMIKHIGDLCADADHWRAALVFYKKTRTLLSNFDNPAWRKCRDAADNIAVQSIAAALRTADGPKAAADYLTPVIEMQRLDVAPLFAANTSQDAYVAASLASDGLFAPDHRTHLLLPPLLLSSHDLTPALQSSFLEDQYNTRRRFWEVLRRQIALGSASESRSTKFFYAKALFDELEKTITKHRDQATFWTATRLFIESGELILAKKISWNESLVRPYVDDDIVKSAINCSGHNEGTKIERLQTVAELFKGWTEVVTFDRAHVAHAMLRHLATTAIENKSSFYGSRDVGGQSIKIIRELAEARPEFRTGAVLSVAEAVLTMLRRSEWWTATQEALKVATLYADVLPDDILTAIVTETLTLLDPIDPSKNIWVIVTPALDFLTSQEVKQLSSRHTTLGEKVVEAVLKFGINQQTEHARLLFFLNDFDLSLLADKASSSQLADVVADVRRKAQANASDAINNIMALLICPAVSRIDGVKDALLALETIFKSALTDRPFMLFSAAYDPLLLITTRFSQIASDLALDPETFRAWLLPLFDIVKQIWIRSKDHPMMFAQFALPPQTKPNAVSIHNWAYASIGFAKLFGGEHELLRALDLAAEQPQLSDAIAMARASRLAVKDFSELDPDTIREENRETFYAALGQRLVSIRDLKSPKPIVGALLDQCLRYGPNGLDAAVFLLASDLGFRGLKANPQYTNYERRLENSRELRLGIGPILLFLNQDNQKPND